MNTKKERIKIRQSYHTRFTRFKNASATIGIGSFVFFVIILKKRKRRKEAAASTTSERISLILVNKQKSIDK